MLPMCRLVCELGKNDPKHELALRHGQVGQGVPPASVKAALALAAATARESGKHQVRGHVGVYRHSMLDC